MKQTNDTYGESLGKGCLEPSDLEYMAECADILPDQLSDCEAALQAAYDTLKDVDIEGWDKERLNNFRLFDRLLTRLNACNVVCIA